MDQMTARSAGLWTAAAGLLVMGSAAGAADYNEALSGDLSDNRLSPTALGPLRMGANTLTGRLGPAGPGGVEEFDLDYATFVVPRGMQLEQLVVRRSDVGGAVSFIGVQAGGQVTVSLTQLDPAPLLGWAHYGSADQGLNILPAIAAGAGARGFAPPLGPGTYTLWIMELDTARDYDYAFELRAGPRCAAEFNGDGVLDPDDLSDYIACFFATPACAEADVNGDGAIDPDDLSDYIGAFFEGC